jgi:outer membrane lipoprotein-sorting protein
MYRIIKFRGIKNKVSFFSLTFITCLFIITSFNFTFAQPKNTLDKSDPKAKVILERLKTSFLKNKTSEVNFDLIIDLVGQKTEKQKGKLIQAGKKYFASSTDQEVFCDGKSVWVYLKDANEVQIDRFDPSATNEIMSPQQIINLYETGQYIYAITGEEMIGNKSIINIEFKPKSKNSEYSKIRMGIDKSDNPNYIKVFSKNSSTFTLVFKDVFYNKTYPNDVFAFKASKYPGVHIEDLRVD